MRVMTLLLVLVCIAVVMGHDESEAEKELSKWLKGADVV